MLQGKHTRKMVAATLFIILFSDTFAPVDTTDMVNLQTGNFTYNIPLIEVPGPEGGYPISLSYHAGIQTNEDASWVGLGWTLNTGAISLRRMRCQRSKRLERMVGCCLRFRKFV